MANKEVILSLDEMLVYPIQMREDIINSMYNYVVYVDSSECSPCKISHMGIWNHFNDEIKDYNANMLLIFNPPHNEVQTLLSTYVFFKQRLPIFVDTLGVFARDNPQIVEKSIMYHSFLLDKNNKIVVVGNASENHYVRDEIFRILSESGDSECNEKEH